MSVRAMDSLWPVIITGLATVLAAVLTHYGAIRANRTTNTVTRVTVEAEAYARAQKIYDGTVDQLQKENARLVSVVERLEARIAVLEGIGT
jgi:cell division protein FtsB